MAAPIVMLIDSLPNEDDKISVLSDLKAALGNLSTATISSIVANVSFNSVFDCLSTNSRNNVMSTGYWRDLTLSFPDGSSATVTVDLPTYRSAVEENDQTVIDEIIKNYMEIQQQSEDTAVCKSNSGAVACDGVDSVESSDSNVCQSRPEEHTDLQHDASNVPPSDTVNWKHEEVLLLISLYTEHQEMFSSSLHKTCQVWRRISEKMKEKGYTFTGVQCDKKFRSLKYRYKTIVDANEKSGRGRRKWEFFEVMDELMAGDPSVKPVAVISSTKVTSKPPIPKQTNCIDSAVQVSTPPRTAVRAPSPTVRATPVRAPSPTVRAQTPPGRTPTPPLTTPTTGEPTRKRRRSSSSEAPQWFTSFVEDHNRQIEVMLQSSNRIAAAAEERNKTLSRLVDAIVQKNKEQLELCCDVLTKLLQPLSPDVILTQFQDDLKTGLTHPEPTVRKLCALELERVSKDMPPVLLQYEEIVIQVVKTMADDVLDVAKSAGNVLVNIEGSTDGLLSLYGGSVLTTLQDVLNSNDTVRFRVYEVIIKISSQSVGGLQRCSESGLLQQFLNEVHRDDILIQLNCLELMSDLALTEHGLLYLDQQGAIGSLENMMKQSESDPLAGFLIPGLVKFFGCVARVHPKEVLSTNEAFVSTVFNNLSTPENASMLNLAVQTVGFIGSSIEGKLALEKLGNTMTTGVRCIGKALRESQEEAKMVILQALANLLRLKVPDQTSELLKLTELWFSHLGTRTFDYLMSLTEQPFPDLRRALLSLFETLSSQLWGQVLMNNQPGFREYLLDRSSEKMKEGKELKFSVVSSLANSPTAAEVFGQPYMVQLKVYCAQGAFFVRAQAEVAMEGDS